MRALLLSWGFVAIAAHAQTISAYRYWFDDDAASANTQSVSGGANYTLNTTWNATALAPGYHRATVQFRDSDGRWGVPRTSVFVRNAGRITGYRYWVNDDVSTLVSTAISAESDVVVAADLVLPTLANDFNSITVQFRDGSNGWGVPYTTRFTKNSGAVNGYEYWIDDAIASSTTGAIGPNNVVDLIADLPTATTSGTHLFTIRFSSTNGSWTVPLTTQFSFFTGVDELPGVSDLLLFPDPVSDELDLRLRSDASRMLDLQVVDAQGAVVSNLPNWNVSGTAYRHWDVTSLAKGMYVLRISSPDHAVNIPFVKQ